MDDNVVKIHSFDGQSVWIDRNTSLYEVGHFLGGGAAGNVYECEHVKTKDHFALKILNPLGYKLLSAPLLRRCTIITKGKIATEITEKVKENLGKEHMWWLVNGSTKQYIAAYFSERQNALKEFSLSQCIQIWGVNPTVVGEQESGEGDATTEVLQTVNGPRIVVPVVPPKYADFVRRRRRIFREIENMRKISNHINVIKLESVLELTQDSKCTLFLVMELANGGELFDRIKIDCGTREDTAKFFFQQLLLGVKHCHDQGVCHRDLKPENLLLQDGIDNVTILKIADFGFSARCAMEVNATNVNSPGAGSSSSAVAQKHSSQVAQMMYMAASPSASDELQRVLKSVVGSPFYVAPEVLQARGYDGPKADIWSLGVILYAMLAGNLPFEQELSTCKRFRLFGKWVREQTEKGIIFHEDSGIDFPTWLFPAKFSDQAKGLIVAMLHPDPEKRISISGAMNHRLLRPEGVADTVDAVAEGSSEVIAAAVETLVATTTGMVQNASTGSLSNLSQNLSTSEILSKPDKISRAGSTHSQGSVQSLPPQEAAAMDIDDQLGTLNDGGAGRQEECSRDEDKWIFKEVQGANDALLPPGHIKSEDNTFREVGKDGDISKQRSFVSDDEMKINTGKSEDLEDVDDGEFQFEMEEDQQTESGDLLTYSTSSVNSSVPAGTPSKNYHVQTNMNFQLQSAGGSASSQSGIAYEYDQNTYYVESPSDDTVAYRSTDATKSVYQMSGSASSELESPRAFARSYESYQRLPPPAPLMMTSPSLDDLIVNEDSAPSELPTPNRDASSSSQMSTNFPPSFNDTVKRSTRFITAVPAAEVLSKVECVLEQYRTLRTQTPIGLIGKIALHWETFRLEVWGNDNIHGPPLCALQLYRMPQTMIAAASPARLSQGYSAGLSSSSTAHSALGYFPDMGEHGAGRSPGGFFSGLEPRMSGGFYNVHPRDRGSSIASTNDGLSQELYLVEFVRGQLEIFAFKRFYDWVRHRLSELVKRDYTSKMFEHIGSPMVPSSMLQRFQEEQVQLTGYYEGDS